MIFVCWELFVYIFILLLVDDLLELIEILVCLFIYDSGRWFLFDARSLFIYLY